MSTRNDYRVSKIIVLCKDCGNDVGLYPARHKCSNTAKPFLPILCSTTTTDSHWSEEDVPDLISSSSSSNVTTPTSVKRQASDSSIESGKWSFFGSSKNSPVNTKKQQENTSYFDSYASNLKTSSSLNDISEASSGKRLWGKMKENEKWKELIADSKKKEEPTTSGKLWERIIHATVSSSVEYHDSCTESDDEDWEGETHVSRILREYYQSKNTQLPSWLYDDNTQESTQMQRSKTTRGGRKLWQQDTSSPSAGSARERERQLLRSNTTNIISRTQSERSFVQPSSSLIHNKQRSSLRSNYLEDKQDDDFVYGSIAPRRTGTIKRAPTVTKSYLDNNNYNTIARSATISQQQNYF